MTFLDWTLDTFPKIRKRSTVLEYKRVFFMIYRKSMNCDFDREAASEIHDYIMGHLTISYALETSTNEKPVLNVDDIYLILHHYWVHDRSKFPDEHQRIQLALMIQIQSYTATRPRVLAYNPEEDNFRTVSYRDIKLFLLPNPGTLKDLLVMEITLRYTKDRKTFILYEVDNLIFDATILIVALAILNQAFKVKVSLVEDIYKIRVTPPRHSLDSGNVGTSPTQPIHYHTYLGYLQRLGILLGFIQILTCYIIRRRSGEAGQLKQVMSRRNASIYQAYIN
ncbi:putative FluG domain containing protein [Rhypophila sp. PSN 637]